MWAAIDGYKTFIGVLFLGLMCLVDGINVYEPPNEQYVAVIGAIVAALRDGTKKAERAASQAADEFRKWRNQ